MKVFSRFLVIRLAIEARIRTDRWAATSAALAHSRALDLSHTTG